MSGTSGPTGSNLSELADRMSLLANRLQARLAWGGSTEYSMTWKRKVTPHGRVYYQLVASGRRTSGPGSSGLASGWRSPTATDGSNGGPNARDRAGNPHLSMEAQLAGWQTPKAKPGEYQYANGDHNLVYLNLEGQVKLVGRRATMATGPISTSSHAQMETDDGTLGFPTTSASRVTGSPKSSPNGGKIAGWPTPKTPTGGGQEVRTTPGGGLRKLEDAVIQCAGWATASSRDWKDTPGMAQTGTNPDGSERERLDQLPRQVTGLMPSPSSAGTEKPGESLRLNPAFSGWLMGYPREWILAGLRAHFHLRGKSKGA